MSEPALLELTDITRTFDQVVANDRVSLRVAPGEIHALLGENGAGKSTLVKIIYGLLRADTGAIHWRGKPVEISSPRQARQLGIGMVFQHFSLFDSLSAAENIALSLEDQSLGPSLADKVSDISDHYGLPLDPQAMVGDLSVGERQRVEIIRCLLAQPSLLVLDEPTSVLTPQEADRLFETLTRLRADGKSILYISHRLEEVRRLCDLATVLRHGRVVASCEPARETALSMAGMMVGTEVKPVQRPALESVGDPLLQLTALSRPAATPFSVALHDIDLQVAGGQVIGIAGVAGNGQSELFEAICGEVRQASPAMIRLAGADAGWLGINARRSLGAAFVPEERLSHAAIGEFSLSRNILLSRHSSDRREFVGPGGWVRQRRLRALTDKLAGQYDVRKPAGDPSANALSGGNLQKFIVGRELDRKPSVLVVNQPTWGVDAGAAQLIRTELMALARSGSAVLVISQDLDELFDISDAIAVMHHGRLSAPIARQEATREQLGLLMTGADNPAANVTSAVG